MSKQKARIKTATCEGKPKLKVSGEADAFADNDETGADGANSRENGAEHSAAAQAEGHIAQPEEPNQNTDSIGPYQILDTIGSGGMGIVYKVRHKGAGTVLAMKVLKKELTADPTNVKRFQQELKAASLISHPNVLPIYDNGITPDGCPYLVMEYLDGYTLENILQEEGFLDMERFVNIFSQVCDALITAHEKRIIHRDLKPGNIMIVTSESGSELVKVLDFGIARVFQRAAKDGARLTQLGEVLGSPLYMSPEQCLSQKLDERSDIYSLGVVMYEALTGVMPFPGDNPVEIIMAHLQKSAAAMSNLRPDFNIPPELENLIFMCLEKEVGLRPERMQDVLNELQRLGQSLKSRRPYLNLKQWHKRMRLNTARKCRQLLERRSQWARPAVAAISTAAACCFIFQQLQPAESIDDLIARADGAMVRQRLDEVSMYWDRAIARAGKEHANKAVLARYNEQAADSLVCYAYSQLGLSSGYNNWNFLRPQDNGDYSRDEMKRANLAKPYLLRALALAGEADHQRLMEKLATIASVENDLPKLESFLRGQLKRNPLDSSLLDHMARILEAQGRNKEAEEYLSKLWRVQETQRNEPFPPAMDRIASIYHNEGRFEDEIKLRQEIVDLLRTYRANNENRDDYWFKEHLGKLASVLRKVGRNEEARALTLEASKIKTS